MEGGSERLLPFTGHASRQDKRRRFQPMRKNKGGLLREGGECSRCGVTVVHNKEQEARVCHALYRATHLAAALMQACKLVHIIAPQGQFVNAALLVFD